MCSFNMLFLFKLSTEETFKVKVYVNSSYLSLTSKYPVTYLAK